VSESVNKGKLYTVSRIKDKAKTRAMGRIKVRRSSRRTVIIHWVKLERVEGEGEGEDGKQVRPFFLFFFLRLSAGPSPQADRT